MKTRLLGFLLLGFVLVPFARAGDDAVVAAVRAADDERIAAMLAANVNRLGPVLSDQLHYAHSSGAVDTKASYLQSIATHRSVYVSVDYVRRDFVPVAPGVVLMEGRVRINAGSSTQQNLLDLNFLGVWRDEGGKWRFVAWQSCKNPPPATK
jgi:Domain of unknown function (DUF4440)